MKGDPVILGIDYATGDDIESRCWLRRRSDGRLVAERVLHVYTNRERLPKDIPDDR